MNPQDKSYVAHPLSPYSDSLPLALLRGREAVMARIRPMLRSNGVTEQQWRVLRTLADVGETETTRLATLVFLLPSSLSRIVRDLEGRGLLARRMADNDQRRALLSATPLGLGLIEQTAPAAAAATAEIEALYGSERLGHLRSLLLDLERLLATREGQEEGT